MRPRLIAVDDAFGHVVHHLGLDASMRPRLIAVDDAERERIRREEEALQGGHGGSPWMTYVLDTHYTIEDALQGGHGGSPWMTL